MSKSAMVTLFESALQHNIPDMPPDAVEEVVRDYLGFLDQCMQLLSTVEPSVGRVAAVLTMSDTLTTGIPSHHAQVVVTIVEAMKQFRAAMKAEQAAIAAATPANEIA
jgi:hypothetical protein